MTTRHIARAVASTGETAPQWHVDLRSGGHLLAIRRGTPITTVIKS